MVEYLTNASAAIAISTPTSNALGDALDTSDIAIQQLLLLGEKEWNQSKIMIVGEGRAGKTALSRSIQGQPFEHTPSTVGIEEHNLTFTKSTVVAGSEVGQWQTRDVSVSELEAGIADMLLARTGEGKTSAAVAVTVADLMGDANTATKERVNAEGPPLAGHDGSSSNMLGVAATSSTTSATNSTNDGNFNPREKQQQPTMSSNDSVTVVGNKKNKRGENKEEEDKEFSGKYSAAAAAAAAAGEMSYDVERIKLLAESIRTNGSKVVISLYDFGGQSVFNVIHHFFSHNLVCMCWSSTWRN